MQGKGYLFYANGIHHHFQLPIYQQCQASPFVDLFQAGFVTFLLRPVVNIHADRQAGNDDGDKALIMDGSSEVNPGMNSFNAGVHCIYPEPMNQTLTFAPVNMGWIVFCAALLGGG